MPTDANFFRDLAYVLLTAGLDGAAARVARQPVIVGHVLGGILVSPFTPGPVVSELPTQLAAFEAAATEPAEHVPEGSDVARRPPETS